MNADRRKFSGSLSLGLALVAMAGLALYFSKDLADRGAISEGDPGPRMLPLVLSVFLLLGGLLEIGRWLVRGAEKEAAAGASWLAALVNRGNINALLMVVVLGLCIAMIGVLGFSLSMFLFATFTMTQLGFPAVVKWMDAENRPAVGNARCWLALLATGLGAVLVSGLSVVTISLVFVHLLKVQLPSGSLGLPF